MDHIEYMRELGRKGGAKRKGHPEASEFARRAALAKWANRKKLIGKPNETPGVEGPKNNSK